MIKALTCFYYIKVSSEQSGQLSHFHPEAFKMLLEREKWFSLFGVSGCMGI